MLVRRAGAARAHRARQTTFTYRGDGRSVCKETPSGTTRFLYDANRLLEETDGSDQLQQQYTSTLEQWGELLSEYDGSETDYHLCDALGSTDALLDDSEAATDRYQYRAFGAQSQQGSHESPFTFVGRENYYRDSELELYYAGARYYDSEAGRWLSEDPIGLAAGDVNLYRYVQNNPVNETDPSGLAETYVLARSQEGWVFVPADPQDSITDAEFTADLAQALHNIQQEVQRSFEEYQRDVNRLMLDTVFDIMDVPENERDMDQATFMFRVALPLIARRRKIAERQKAIDDAAWKYRHPMSNVEYFSFDGSTQAINTFNLDPKIKEYYASGGLLLRHGPAITGAAALEYSQWDLPALEKIYLLAEQDVRWEDPAYRQGVYLGYGLTGAKATLPIAGPMLSLLDPDSSSLDRTLAVVDIIADAVGIGFFGNISAFSRLREIPEVADAAELADTAVHAKRVARGSVGNNLAPTRAANATRTGVTRTNPSDWRQLRDLWDDIGYGDILSETNRKRIAKGQTPRVDDAWIRHFPGDEALKGEKIPMHHIQGGPITVPLPASRHLDAHMPGGYRYNPGGPGTSG